MIEPNSSDWWVYLVQCADGTFYAGVCTDFRRRLRQHNGELVGGAKYTSVRRPCQLAYLEPAKDRSSACQREYRLRKKPRAYKQTLSQKWLADQAAASVE